MSWFLFFVVEIVWKTLLLNIYTHLLTDMGTVSMTDVIYTVIYLWWKMFTSFVLTYAQSSMRISKCPTRLALCLSFASVRDSEPCGVPVWSQAALPLAWPLRCCVAVQDMQKQCNNNDCVQSSWSKRVLKSTKEIENLLQDVSFSH